MFLDVRGLSDDHTAHPRYTVRFDEPEGTMLRLPDNHPDCRHFCQNCQVYRQWNSQLARLLHPWGRNGRWRRPPRGKWLAQPPESA